MTWFDDGGNTPPHEPAPQIVRNHGPLRRVLEADRALADAKVEFIRAITAAYDDGYRPSTIAAATRFTPEYVSQIARGKRFAGSRA